MKPDELPKPPLLLVMQFTMHTDGFASVWMVRAANWPEGQWALYSRLLYTFS